jgi:hypothetical protein
MSHILLNDRVGKLSADQTFGIEDGVMRIFGDLILGRVTDESFSLSEADVRWSCSISLIVYDDLNSVVLPHTHAGVGSTQINTDSLV